MMSAPKNPPEKPIAPDSHLFTIRLWRQDLANGQVEWRGKVQHVLCGQAVYFSNWESLEGFLSNHGEEKYS